MSGCLIPLPEIIYPINYGYVDGVFAGDGVEQDVYLFGLLLIQIVIGNVAYHRLKKEY